MSRTNHSHRRLAPVLLVIILAIAAGLRFYNLNWDNGTFAHPDERSTVVFYAPTIRWPDDLSTILDPRTSTLNPFWDTSQQLPRSYTYGHFPLYTLVLVAHGLHTLAPLTDSFLPSNWTQFLEMSPSGRGYAQIGRALMALADLFTVYLVFLLGRRLYGWWGGLLAAALSTFTVLQIQLAHFFAVDPISTTFTLLALYGAMLMYDRQSRGAAVITGLGIGLAIASKFSALPIAFAPIMAAYLATADRRPPTADRRAHRGPEALGPPIEELHSSTLNLQSPIPSPHAERSSFSRMFGLAMLALVVACVIFAVTSPFVLLDFENFTRAVIEEQGNMVSGVADMPFTRQYRNTPAYWYFVQQQLRWGMGWPLGLLAFGGLLWVVIKAVRGKAHPGEWIILLWIVLYFGPTGLFLAKFMRYMIPVVPLFTLFGAGMVVALWRIGEWANEPQSVANAPLSLHERISESANQPLRVVDPIPDGTSASTVTSEPIGEPANLLSHPDQAVEDDASNLPIPRGHDAFQYPEGSVHGLQASPRGTMPSNSATPPVSSPAPHRLSASRPLPRKFARVAAIALAVIALGGAAFWALAFVNGVYRTEHPWVTFARWTYANVPDGACIAREHWDEGIPTGIDEPGGNPGAHGYVQPELPMYEEDTQQKYEYLRSTLMNCDYIALASNRLWRTIPRLPERYPMSTRYYQALFSGELGFEPVYSVETPPRLGPLVIDDQPADESFTVYDHPKPIMFKKTRQLTPAEWDAILGNTWQGAIPGYVGSPTLLMRLRGASNTPQAISPFSAERESKSLLLDSPVDQLPVVNDFRWNTIANNSTFVAVVFWWLVVMLIGVMAFPVTFLLFNNLPDRGYGFSKSLGLLLASYFVWLNSSLGWLSNTVTTAIIALIVLGGFSLWATRTYRQSFRQFWREQWTLILATEIVFSLIYLFFIYLRLLNPDLWQPWLGGEKMLEIGFLNAVVKSAHMPPYDPFFAGGILNYYYYGLFLVGVLIKLTGIQPSVAFNLAVPTLAALTAINVFSLVGNLTVSVALQTLKSATGTSPGPQALYGKARKASQIHHLRFILTGLLGILLVVFIGNLEGAAQFMRELGKVSQSEFQSAIPGLQTFVLAVNGLVQAFKGATVAMYNYWDPTRVIPATINEFPYFSFLFADLHPHMIGLPFTVLFLSLAYNWLANRRMAAKRGEWINGQRADERMSEAPVVIHHSSSLAIIHPLLARSFTDMFTRPFAHSLIRSFGRWLALPFVLGAIAVINTWDLPTYLGLMVVTFLLGRYFQEREAFTLNRAFLLLVSGVLFAGALLAMTLLLYAPFFANYQAPAETGLGLVHTQTALDQHLKIWGFFLFIIVSWLWLSLLYPATRNSLLRSVSLVLRRWNVWPHLAEIYRKVVKAQDYERYQWALWGLGLVLFISVALALLDYPVPAYLLPIVMLALILLFRQDIAADGAYLGVLIFTGLLILLGVEFFFLRDFLGGGEYYRMNTLFKFFTQVWVIFGVVAAVTLPRLWQWSDYWPLPGQLLWRAAVAILLMACLIYPVLGTRTRVDDRFPGDQNRPPLGTLDGLAYMTVGTFEWPAGSPIQLKYDYEAIRWLQDNVPGTPIIAEAKIGYYREGGMRVAAYTGLPSILGGLHQNEQRYSWQVGDRDFVVNEFWFSPDPARTLQLMHELNISYIYIGQIERITYGATLVDKFEQLRAQGALELVFENEQTRIYKRIR